MEKNKKKLFISIGICMLLMLPFVISGIISDHVGNEIVEEAVKLAGRVLSAAGVLFYIKKAYKIEIGIKKENLVKGMFRYGILIFCTVIFNIVCEYQRPEISFLKAAPALLFYLVTNMGIGLMEETVCRGFLFNIFRGYWGESKKGIYLATFVSAFIFGAIHFFNLNGHNTVATLTQVAYATFFGALFAVVYYRSGNLLSCIILHGLVDFSAHVWPCFLEDRAGYFEQQDVTDYPLSMVLLIAAITLPLIISALVQLHNEFKYKKDPALITKESSAFKV
jgi:membrane protease YdiL (CAAX protease family)